MSGRCPIGGGVPSRLTFTPNMDGFPIWSHDGQRLIFTGLRDAYHLFERLPSGEERSLFTKAGTENRERHFS